jgi:replicative DNA helicase
MAHVVLLIYMPAERGRTGEDEIIIFKNRHGPVGAIEVTFSPERLKFLTRQQAQKSEPNCAVSEK